MPLIRVLADGLAYGSPGVRGPHGQPVFESAGSAVELITLDYTAWLGAETNSTSAWTTDLANAGADNTGPVVSLRVTMPASDTYSAFNTPAAYKVTHTMTTSGGRVRAVVLWLTT